MDKCIQKTLYAFTAFVVLSACGEEKLTPTPTPGSKEIIVLSELVNPIIFTSDGGTETIDFRAPDSWTAGIINGKADSWCTVKPASGRAGEGSISITCSENDLLEERYASVYLKSGNETKYFNVTQKQKDCGFRR